MRLSDKLPPHENLGELTFLEEEEETGDKIYYRPCLTRWSDKEIKDYKTSNDRCWFDWVIYGANPVFGVSAWLVKGEKI